MSDAPRPRGPLAFRERQLHRFAPLGILNIEAVFVDFPSSRIFQEHRYSRVMFSQFCSASAVRWQPGTHWRSAVVRSDLASGAPAHEAGVWVELCGAPER